MCQLCNGTNVINENLGCGIYRTSCCPVCGPVSDEEWRRELEEILAMAKGANKNEKAGSNHSQTV